MSDLILNVMKYFDNLKSKLVNKFEIGNTVYLIRDKNREPFIVEEKTGIRYSGVLKNSCMGWRVRDRFGGLWNFREDSLTKDINYYDEDLYDYLSKK